MSTRVLRSRHGRALDVIQRPITLNSVEDVIASLKDPKGASAIAIQRSIQSEHPDMKEEQCKALLRAVLLEGLDSGRLRRPPGSKVRRGLVGRFLLKATDGTSVETLPAVPETQDGRSVETLPAVPETQDGPSVETLPAVPETQDGPSVETLPAVPETQDGLSVETLPAVPETQDGPSAETLPAVPETQDGPSAETLPAVPETRDGPSVETLPTVPETQDGTSAEKVPAVPETQDRTSVETLPAVLETQDGTSAEKVPAVPETQDRTSAETLPAVPETQDEMSVEKLPAVPETQDDGHDGDTVEEEEDPPVAAGNLTFDLEEPCTPAAYVQRVQEKRDRLVGQCQEAEKYLNYRNLPAHALEQVRIAVGRSRLITSNSTSPLARFEVLCREAMLAGCHLL